MASYQTMTGLIGGGAGNVDGRTSYSNGDVCLTNRNGTFLVHVVDTSFSQTEDIPAIITPDSGSGRWIWQPAGGFIRRSQFIYSSTTAIIVSFGVYTIIGASNMQSAVIPNALTYTLTSLSGTDWHYLYLDMSAIETNGHPIITSSELYDSTDEPSKENSRGGWYHGTTTDDLCIGAFYAVSGSIKRFHHVGDWVYWDADVSDLAMQDIDTSWTDVTHTAPVFSDIVKAVYRSSAEGDATVTSVYARRYASSESRTLYLCDNDNCARPSVEVTMPLGSSQRTQVSHSVAGTHETYVGTYGYSLGIGM